VRAVVVEDGLVVGIHEKAAATDFDEARDDIGARQRRA
jgi:hypothetical protein